MYLFILKIDQSYHFDNAHLHILIDDELSHILVTKIFISALIYLLTFCIRFCTCITILHVPMHTKCTQHIL